MKNETKVIRINGTGLSKFGRSFGGYVSTGAEDSSAESDFTGKLTSDGSFYILRKGREKKQGLNYDARLTGKVFEENGDTVIEYNVEMSPVFKAATLVMGVIAAGISAVALLRFFKDMGSGLLLPASFFVIAFVVMLLILIIKPECRAVEKCMDKIAGDYAAQLDK